MGGRRFRGSASIWLAGVLALAALGAPAGSLAGPRVIFFGSPGTNGITVLSPVQIGAETTFRLLLRNDSIQRLNHAAILFGDNAGPNSLTAGASITNVLGPDSLACAGFTARTMLCDYGQLRSGDSRSITVFVNPGSASPLNVRPIAQINETQGTTNPDTFAAPGSTTPFTAGDKIGFVVPTGQPFKGETSFGTNGLKIGINIARNATGLDTLGILEDDGADFCPVAFTCFGPTTRLAINFGDTLSPPALLSITSEKSIKIGGLLHKLDDGTIVDIPNTKAGACKTTVQTDCVVSTKPFTVRIDENGLIKIH